MMMLGHERAWYSVPDRAVYSMRYERMFMPLYKSGVTILEELPGQLLLSDVSIDEACNEFPGVTFRLSYESLAWQSR